MGYCSFWFDGVWGKCCEVHDIQYQTGFDKFQADLELLSCVSSTGYPIIGFIMFIGVSLFGWFFYKRNKK